MAKKSSPLKKILGLGILVGGIIYFARKSKSSTPPAPPIPTSKPGLNQPGTQSGGSVSTEAPVNY